MKHAVIVRFNYPEKPDTSEKVEFRFSYFRTMVLPRLLAQRNKDFTIAVRTNGDPEWDERFKRLSDRIITFHSLPEFPDDWRPDGYTEQEWKQKKSRFFVDFTPFESLRGLPRFDIQTSLDSDDLLLRDDFIDTIEAHFAGKTDTAHLHFYPYLFDVPSLSFYKAPFKYGPGYGSPFYSLYQPEGSGPYIFAGHDSHLRIGKYMKDSHMIEAGFAAFSIHGKNESSKLYPSSIKISL